MLLTIINVIQWLRLDQVLVSIPFPPRLLISNVPTFQRTWHVRAWKAISTSLSVPFAREKFVIIMARYNLHAPSLAMAAFLVPFTATATININVGNPSGAAVFEPASARAAVGDTITFNFYPNTHSVVQGTFEFPCIPADRGFYLEAFSASDGQANGTTFSVLVENEDPIWFFCGVGVHCGYGMVGVINEP
jgi:plastocyanin